MTNANVTTVLPLYGNADYNPTAAFVAAAIAKSCDMNAIDKKAAKDINGKVTNRVLFQYAECSAFIAFQGIALWNKSGATDMREALKAAKVSKATADRLTMHSAALVRYATQQDRKNKSTLVEAFAKGPENVMAYFEAADIQSANDLYKKVSPDQAQKGIAEKTEDFLVEQEDAELEALLQRVKARRAEKKAKAAEEASRKAKVEAHAKAQREARNKAKVKNKAKGETVATEAA
jgi:hypothetical protein